MIWDARKVKIDQKPKKEDSQHLFIPVMKPKYELLQMSQNDSLKIKFKGIGSNPDGKFKFQPYIFLNFNVIKNFHPTKSKIFVHFKLCDV